MADERIYTIPLQDAYEKPSTKRARRAVKLLRSFVARHMRVEEEAVSISGDTNALIWRDGMKKPPRRIKVKVSKEKDKASVTLLDEGERAAKIKARQDRKASEKKARAQDRQKEAAAKPAADAKKQAHQPQAAASAEVEKAKLPAQAAKPAQSQNQPSSAQITGKG